MAINKKGKRKIIVDFKTYFGGCFMNMIKPHLMEIK